MESQVAKGERNLAMHNCQRSINSTQNFKKEEQQPGNSQKSLNNKWPIYYWEKVLNPDEIRNVYKNHSKIIK